jgi:hypothetical protein
MELLRDFLRFFKRIPRYDTIGMLGENDLKPRPNIFIRTKAFFLNKIIERRYLKKSRNYELQDQLDEFKNVLKKHKKKEFIKNVVVISIFGFVCFQSFQFLRRDQLEKRELYIKKKKIKQEILQEK